MSRLQSVLAVIIIMFIATIVLVFVKFNEATKPQLVVDAGKGYEKLVINMMYGNEVGKYLGRNIIIVDIPTRRSLMEIQLRDFNKVFVRSDGRTKVSVYAIKGSEHTLLLIDTKNRYAADDGREVKELTFAFLEPSEDFDALARCILQDNHLHIVFSLKECAKISIDTSYVLSQIDSARN